MLFLRDDGGDNVLPNYEVINQPMLMCTFIAILLFGVTCAQTFYYFHRFPNDGYKIRCMLAFIWLLEAAHSALLLNVINHILIAKAGDILSLLYIYHGIPIAYMFGYLSTYLVNLFYVWHISTISRSPIMFAIAGVLATARFGAELSFCIMSYIHSDWLHR
ncbi:hypothetical protein BJ138DRAFT_605966 [Hygrophoropsis aurantiaca]|uniref:Uncharacterized protein n=1 Tax=Hygrophoropsis aurantiaca TaxID=72124 RepID=A0ACB8AKP1_9AGAM|nr:hypothetical protein BJ138DRAFT_605966 [Hygrophoropsis aurantiaca]